MARIYSRGGKKGTIWYLDYSVDGNRVRKRLGSSKRLARLALADIQVKLERREAGFTSRDKKLSDFIREYLAYAKGNKAKTSYERDVLTLRHFTEIIKGDRLASILPAQLEAYKAKRRQLGPIIETFLHTGLRRDELVHLTWDDVDFKRESLAVQAKDGWHPKDYEVRHIPLSERLVEVLKGVSRGKSPYVFHTQSGGPHHGNILSRDFRKLVRSLGFKGVSVHKLRHTFASHLIMGGADLYTVGKLLGHSSIKTTEIYAHLAPDYLRSAVRGLKY